MRARHVAILLTAFAIGFAADLMAQDGAGRKEEVVLRSGLTGIVQVVATDVKSITVKWEKGEAKLLADEVDPHCFYDIRNRYMENTAENHVALAIYAAGAGMFHRAKHQKDIAESMEPDIVERLKKQFPDLEEKVVGYLMERAERLYRSGSWDASRQVAELVSTRWGETKAAAGAHDLLKKLDAEKEQADSKAEADRQAKLEGDQKKQDEERKDLLAPVSKAVETGQKLVRAGMQQSNSTTGKKMFDEAGTGLEQTVARLDGMKKSHGGKDEELDAMIGKLTAEAKSEAVSAWIAAGNICISRRSLNEAQKYAQRALAVAPDDPRAQAFQRSVRVASSDSGWWGTGGREGRRGGGRRR